MRSLVKDYLTRLKVDLVPGYSISLRDILGFRKRLFGISAPLTLYGRWRANLAGLVPESHFNQAGLDNMKVSYPGKYDRQLIVIQCLHSIISSEIPGIVAEFGCYEGHTAIQILQALKLRNDLSPVLLFDSFEGLPSSSHAEDSCWKPGDLRANESDVVKRFAGFPNVTVVKGFFKDTLSRHNDLQFKFAHVDADLYSSTVEINAWLLDRIVPGGMIIYDDYGFGNCRGVQMAVDESMRQRSEFLTLYLPTGQYIAVKR